MMQPTVDRFIIKRLVDEEPDLSYIENNERLESYDDGIWEMLFVEAFAEYKDNDQILTLNSGGIGGIESDDKAGIAMYEKEELKQVKLRCKDLGIKYSRDTPVEWSDDD